MPGVVHFLDPYRYRSTFHRTNPDIPESEFCQDYLNHLEEIIRFEGAETIAAILIESVTGTNGVIIPPEGFLAGVRECCDAAGALMIDDEVQAGMGRTGKWLAIQHEGVKPDIVTLAKGIASGFPVGALVAREGLEFKKGEHGCLLFAKDLFFSAPAYPLEDIHDPTGAGDCFAGAFTGCLARTDCVDHDSLRKAVVYGSVVASYCVEDFSLTRLQSLTQPEIKERYDLFKLMSRFEVD